MPYPRQVPAVDVPSLLRVLLALGILGNLAAVWTVPWLPLGDLGLQTQLLDIVARYRDGHTGYHEWYILPHPLDPETLPLWLAYLAPFAKAWTLARLLLSAYIIGLPLAVLALARAFGRPPWLVLLALPLTWNALCCAGYLGALLALPVLFATLAATRALAARGGILRALAVSLGLALLFFCDVLTFGLGVVAVALLIFWHREDMWSLSRLWVVVPSLPLVAQWLWRLLLAAQMSMLRHMMDVQLPPPPARLPPRQLLAQLYDWTLLFFRDRADVWLAVALLALWLLLMAIGIYDLTHADRGMLDPKSFERRMFGRRKLTWERLRRTLAPGLRPARERRRLRWRDVEVWLNPRSLEVLTLATLAAYAVLPTRFHGAPIVAERALVPALLFLTLWPQPEWVEWRRWLAIPLAAVALGYPYVVRAEFAAFGAREVAGLAAALDELPDRSRLAYVMWETDSQTVFKGALWSLPPAIFAAAHGGLVDQGPAQRPNATLQLRKGVDVPQLGAAFWLDPRVFDVDFVLLRSAATPTAADESASLRQTWHEGHWWLYEVLHGDRKRVTAVVAGGPGGQGAYSDCPRGALLQGLIVQPGTHAIHSVVPLCQAAAPALPVPPLTSGAPLGTPLPEAATSQLLCPHGQYVVALTGRADRYVTALQVQCSEAMWPLAQNRLIPTRLVGAAAGKDFDLRCPEQMVAVGLQGRFGEVADQIGIGCAEPAVW